MRVPNAVANMAQHGKARSSSAGGAEITPRKNKKTFERKP